MVDTLKSKKRHRARMQATSTRIMYEYVRSRSGLRADDVPRGALRGASVTVDSTHAFVLRSVVVLFPNDDPRETPRRGGSSTVGKEGSVLALQADDERDACSDDNGADLDLLTPLMVLSYSY